MQMVVILDNIRSAHNVGAIFRTSDGAGVSKIYLCGYTPTPVDRFGRIQPEIAKTSLGATQTIPWERASAATDVVEALRADGFTILAIEQTPQAIPYTTWSPTEKVAFIFGNEIDGVSVSACATADAVLHIPMHGHKESLNVSTTVGIILFHVRSL